MFSRAGIYNVAILTHHKDPDYSCVFFYHNPFTRIRDGTFTRIINPSNISIAFPNKLRNLYGHRMNLIAVNDPPHVIIKNHSIVGINMYLYEIFLKRWNATYNVDPCYKNRLSKCFKSIVNDLCVNNFPFFTDAISIKFDYQPYLDIDKIGILVRDKPVKQVFGYIALYLFND